jgi:hypothetical protein
MGRIFLVNREPSSEADKITITEARSTIDSDSTSKVDQNPEPLLDSRVFSSNMLSKKGFWMLIAVLTVFLFGVTGWIQFSCYPMVTSGVLPKFCSSQEAKLRIIKDPRTHGKTLEILASDPQSDESVLRTLVSYFDSPKVANSPRVLQYRLASNLNTPTDVLDRFVKSEDVEVLKNIAGRTNASSKLLREVANNPKADSTDVQEALIKNPQIPEDVLQKLASSGELKILIGIAKSTRASANILRTVSNNPVASNPIAQRALAINKNAPEDILRALADSTDLKVLYYAINNPNISTLILEKVGNNTITWKDASVEIQTSLAENPNTPPTIMERLASSKYREVLEALYFKNLNVSPPLKEVLKQRLKMDLETKSPESKLSLSPEGRKEISEKNNSNCTDKHLRNNLIGGAAAAIGFLFGGPVGAVAAYGAVTGSLETATTASSCLF